MASVSSKLLYPFFLPAWISLFSLTIARVLSNGAPKPFRPFRGIYLVGVAPVLVDSTISG